MTQRAVVVVIFLTIYKQSKPHSRAVRALTPSNTPGATTIVLVSLNRLRNRVDVVVMLVAAEFASMIAMLTVEL